MSFASGYCILRHVREKRAQLLEMSGNKATVLLNQLLSKVSRLRVFFFSDLQWIRINFDGKKALFCQIQP